MAETNHEPNGARPSDPELRPDAHLSRDALTGLLTTPSFLAVLAARMAADRGGIGVAIIELRGLSRFNDEQGRIAGDTMLVALARRLERLARAEFGVTVSLGRLDGARFGLIAPDGVSIGQLRAEIRAFVSAMGDMLPTGSGQLSLRIALGTIAAHERVDDSLRRIARRLAAAQSQIRAIDIEAALDNEGLSVLFQPQIEIATGAIVGAEALVRWQHPRLGEVGGAVLFAAAANAGLERAPY